MTITVNEKKDLVKEFGSSNKDTGSTEVQVAILTKRINSLSEHNNNEERDSIFLIKCNSELVSIANLKKGYIIPRRNFNN